MILWLAVALAAEIGIVPERGPVRPGQAVVLQLAATDSLDQPTRILDVEASAGRVQILAAATDDTRTRVRWLPPDQPGKVRFTIQTAGATLTSVVEVQRPDPPRFVLPERADAVDGRPISLRIEGDGPLDLETTRVYVSEPAEAELISEDEGGTLQLRLSGEGARSVVVGLVSEGGYPSITATRIAVLARPTLSFDLEPRARLTVGIGGRRYGPVQPGPEGRARITIDQRPGETTAELIVADELGNALTSPYVLSARSAGPLVLAPLGPALAEDLPPNLVVLAARPGGAWLVAPAPSCRSGDQSLSTSPIAPGTWSLDLPAAPVPVGGLRILCETPEGRGEHLVVLPAGRPSRIDLSVWPEVVDTDSPRADVAAYVLDDRGERIPETGLKITARHGEFQPTRSAGAGVRGSYVATEPAIRVGRDIVAASLDLPRGEGTAVTIEVGAGRSDDGEIAVVAIPRDRSGRAIADLPIRLGLQGRESEVRTDRNGRAVARYTSAPPVLVAVAQVVDDASIWGIVAPREAAWTGPRPDGPDIEALAYMAVQRGRITSIRIEPEQRIVLSGEGASTRLILEMLDRKDSRVEEIPPVIEVSAGTVDPPRAQPDGTWLVVLRPPADGRSRVIDFRASSPSGEATAMVELRVDPRPILLAVGVGIGASSNLGALASPLLGVDLDIGIPGRIRGAMLRVGISTLSYSGTTNTEFGEVRNQLTLVPVTLGALIRRRSGGFSVHGGVGALIVPLRAESRFDDVRRPPRAGLTPPGFVGILGAARRIGAGELAIEARANLIYSQGTASGFAGQIGGIAALLSYRLLID